MDHRSHRHRRVALALAVTCLVTTRIGAVEPAPLITDRPDQTESSDVVPQGSFQLEAGWIGTRENDGPLRIDSQQVPSTLTRFGLTPRLEARVGWGGWNTSESEPGAGYVDLDGAGDASLGAKWKLRQGSDDRATDPRMSLIGTLSIPTGADEFSSRRVDPAIVLTGAHALGSRLSLGWNAGLIWGSDADASGERDTTAAGRYTAVVGYSASDRVGIFVEAFGDLPVNAPGGPAHSLDGGFTWLVGSTVQLDASIGFGLNDPAPDAFVGLGLSFRVD